MVPERGMPGESFVAHLAHVRLLSAVRSLVVLQVGRLRKLHSARVAPIRLLARMDAHVVLEIHRFGECQSADQTLVVLLACVKLPVRPQGRVPRELSAADVAIKRLFAPRREEGKEGSGLVKGGCHGISNVTSS